jgi:hypothetical protein
VVSSVVAAVGVAVVGVAVVLAPASGLPATVSTPAPSRTPAAVSAAVVRRLVMVVLRVGDAAYGRTVDRGRTTWVVAA